MLDLDAIEARAEAARVEAAMRLRRLPSRCRAGMKPTQQDTLDFVRSRWPDHVSPQARLNKLGEEYGEVVGAFVKMGDGTGRKTLADLAQETAQLVICAMALAEAAGFDLETEIEDEWWRAGNREWPRAVVGEA